MKTRTVWKERMHFEAECGTNHVQLDASAPFGQGQACTPKELLVISVSGCTAMDVVGYLKKNKQVLESLEIDAEVEKKENSLPSVFSSIMLTFKMAGQIDPKIAFAAVELSQTKYCGVSAMLATSVKIAYQVFVNGDLIGTGRAHFSES